jgi:hypothetical protein
VTSVKLDSPLRDAAKAGTPVQVVDPDTQRVYYLISAEQFRQMAMGATGEFEPRLLYPMIDQVMAEDDAEDPLLDGYQ